MAKPGREVEKASDRDDAPQRLLRRLQPRPQGARVVYGKPVRNGDVTVIPVAKVSGGLGFGYGFGSREGEDGGGGGGGSSLNAKPVGYVEVTPQGARFKRILDVEGTLRAAGRAAVGVALAAAILRRTDRGWRPRAYAALLTRRR
jgi:hypothetical protein